MAERKSPPRKSSQRKKSSTSAPKKSSVTAVKPKMRAALVDLPIHREDFDSITMRSPDTLLIYELVVFRPEGSFIEYDSYSREYNGLPSLNETMSRYIEQDAKRRKAEITELLSSGATVVVIEPCLMQCYIDSGQRSHSGTGRNRQTTILVAPFELWSQLMPIKIPLSVGRGKDVELTTHQLAVPLRGVVHDLQYESFLPTDDLTPIAYMTGKKIAIAGVKKVGRGHLVLLPGLQPKTAYEDEDQWLFKYGQFLDAIKEIHKRLTPATSSEIPEWAKQIATDAELEKRHELETRLAAVDAEQLRVEEARRELLTFDERKLLLTATGKALERTVAATLERLGLEVELRDDDRTDLIVRSDAKIAVAEVKGLTGSAGENNAAQAEKWVSMYHADHGTEPKGILIVNAFREQPILTRNGKAFPDQMMKYVQKKELALVTTAQLFVADVLRDKEPDRVREFCSALFTTVGEVAGFSDVSEVLQAVTTERE